MLPAAAGISYVYCRMYLWYEYERLVGLKNVLSLDAFFEELHNMAPAYYNHFRIWTSFRAAKIQLF